MPCIETDHGSNATVTGTNGKSVGPQIPRALLSSSRVKCIAEKDEFLTLFAGGL